MMKENTQITILENLVASKIYYIRDKREMIDKDLAELYEVETRALNQAVSRNLERFPELFMFQLTQAEFEILMSQFVTSSWGGTRKLPYVFTEHGVAMLSSILRSKKAIQVNIQIMLIFSKVREMLVNNLNLKLDIEEIKKKLENHNKSIDLVFNYLDELIEKQKIISVTKRIGYKRKSER